MFWGGYVLLGSALPYGLLLLGGARCAQIASMLVILGGLALLYVFIIGGQAFPLDLFPGYAVASSFHDGAIEHYAPTLPEVLLGLGGMALAFVLTIVGVRVFNFLPEDDFGPIAGSATLLD